MEKKKINLLIIAAVAITAFVTLMLYLAWMPGDNQSGPVEQSCIASGGTISTGMCCGSVTDFPNTCLIGACGCSPTDSHQVQKCECPTGKCFDGEKCVGQQL